MLLFLVTCAIISPPVMISDDVCDLLHIMEAVTDAHLSRRANKARSSV